MATRILAIDLRETSLFSRKTIISNSKPTQDDLNNLLGLLGGFRIVDIEIPEFLTLGELERWRDITIKNALAEC
ncbi:MAG: hypothetical protein LBS21_13165 [Clostridiales bacterium]|nr:hypothetical protein [Clostridiales bacterium]